jgi:uncharacterized membrane protein HdeD (DUF308 family)
MAIARALLEDLTDHWWVILVRGIAAVVFGVVAFVLPGATLLAVIFIWGAYAVIDGAFALYMTYLTARQGRRWWPYLLEGVVGVGAGAVAFGSPGLTALALLYLIAAWAIVTGIVEVVAAVEMRTLIQNEWLLGVAGVLSVVFGVLVAIQPDAGALAVVWIIGTYALLFGIALIGLAFRVRSMGKRLHASAAA